MRITHGRHCNCSACEREDWTQPHLAPCGMHGEECPPRYAPLGPPGAIEPSPLDPPGVIKPSPLEILAETFDRHNFKPSIGQALLVGYLLGRVAEHMIGNPERMREWAEFTISTMADTRKKAA